MYYRPTFSLVMRVLYSHVRLIHSSETTGKSVFLAPLLLPMLKYTNSKVKMLNKCTSTLYSFTLNYYVQVSKTSFMYSFM